MGPYEDRGSSMHHYDATGDPDWLAYVQADYRRRRAPVTGADAVRQLDEQQSDPVEARALSHLREAQRQHEAGDRTSVPDALKWLRDHHPMHEGPLS